MRFFFQLAKNNLGLPLFVLVPSPSEKPWFRRNIVVMLRFARTWTFWSICSITDSMILSQCDWICSSVALYCFKLVRVQEPTHMHFALLHGYFRPISIKDHGMREFTNQRAGWWNHVWLWILYSRGRVSVHHLSLSSGHCRNSNGQWWPLPIAILVVANPVFFYLLTYVNECKWVDHDEFCVDWVYCFYGPGDQTRKPPPITVLAVAWTQAQVVNSNSTSSGKETRLAEYLKGTLCEYTRA